MDVSEKLFGCSGEWNLSFAGCGFRSVYYVGALSCFLDHVPQLVHGASRFCGASSGCLVAAALAVGFPIEQLCADVLTVAREARRRPLGVFQPTFGLLRCVEDVLQEKLPADAHLRASGRLCVSLTRLSDGKNVLVSQFDSREELIQVLVCSCFFPVYCGFVPPSYRGVLYMDGALSNNLPLFELRNTITVAPFSGESDICPQEGTLDALQVHYGNVSVKMLADICHDGYRDALRFLSQQDLLRRQSVPPAVAMKTRLCCQTVQTGQDPARGDRGRLDPKVTDRLPLSLRTVLCEACRAAEADAPLLPARLLSLLLLPARLSLLLLIRVKSLGGAVIGRLLTGCSGTPSCRSRGPDSDITQQHSSRTHHTESNNSCTPDHAPFNCPDEGLPPGPAHKTPVHGKVTLRHRSK